MDFDTFSVAIDVQIYLHHTEHCEGTQAVLCALCEIKYSLSRILLQRYSRRRHRCHDSSQTLLTLSTRDIHTPLPYLSHLCSPEYPFAPHKYSHLLNTEIY